MLVPLSSRAAFVVVTVVAVVVKVAVVVANRRCEGDEFRVYIKFGPHQ